LATFELEGQKSEVVGKAVYKEVERLMMTERKYDELIIVYIGQNVVPFSHAATFVAVLTNKIFRQVYLLDCKNDFPLKCTFSECRSDNLFNNVEVKEDIGNQYYHKWELYAI
jgi:hypothetical protein